jgi:ubiquinol-cytochrome c reductase cytochrome c1 subunit
MPHVLWELQGIQHPVYKYAVHHDGHTVASFDTEAEADAYVKEQQGGEYRLERVVEGLQEVQSGSLTPAEYDQVARDLAAFLTYISEPMKLERQRMGVWVVLFLIVFSVIAYLMKKEWWKDIH